MAETFTWDQSKFDRTLADYLRVHNESTWPRCLNKKAFFVALAAVKETPKTGKDNVQLELMQGVYAPTSSKTGTRGAYGNAPIGYIVAAKRASKQWSGLQFMSMPKFGNQSMNLGLRMMWMKQAKKAASMFTVRNWRALEKQTFDKMLGARSRAGGFIRVGWISVMKALGNKTGMAGKVTRNDAGTDAGSKLIGVKGSAVPAEPGKLVVTIMNTAHAKSEHGGGFERLGGEALQRAFNIETASMVKYLEEEMQPGIQKFNSQQR